MKWSDHSRMHTFTNMLTNTCIHIVQIHIGKMRKVVLVCIITIKIYK